MLILCTACNCSDCWMGDVAKGVVIPSSPDYECFLQACKSLTGTCITLAATAHDDDDGFSLMDGWMDGFSLVLHDPGGLPR